MSDTTAKATDGTSEPGTTPPAGTPAEGSKTPTPDEALAAALAEAEKWKTLSRKNEARAKENADAATKLAEIEAAQMSEAEKMAKRAEDAEKRLAELQTVASRNAIAAEFKLPADALRGNTDEELRAHAEILAQLRGPEQTTDYGAGRPGAGSIGGGKVEQLTREQLQSMTPQEIVAAEEAGKLADLLGQS